MTSMSQDSSGTVQQVPSTPLLTRRFNRSDSQVIVPDVGSQGSSRQSTPFVPLIFRIEGVPCTSYSVNSARTCPPTPNWMPIPFSSGPGTLSVKSSPDIQTVPSTVYHSEMNSSRVSSHNDLKNSDSPSHPVESTEAFDWFDNLSSQSLQQAQQVSIIATNTKKLIVNKTSSRLSQENERLNCLQNSGQVNTQVAMHRSTLRSLQQADRVNLMLNGNLHPKTNAPDYFNFNSDSIFA